MSRKWRDPELATLLWNCLPNTLDTTVWQSPTKEDGRSFISTGDIAAMWLRDSQNQVLPYNRFAKAEPDQIGLLIRGLIKRHVSSVLLDPYANSFSFSPADIECNVNAWVLDNTTMIDPASGERVNAMTVGVHQRTFFSAVFFFFKYIFFWGEGGFIVSACIENFQWLRLPSHPCSRAVQQV